MGIHNLHVVGGERGRSEACGHGGDQLVGAILPCLPQGLGRIEGLPEGPGPPPFLAREVAEP